MNLRHQTSTILLIVAILSLYIIAERYLGFDQIHQLIAKVQQWTTEYPILVCVSFAITYIVLTAASIPAASALSLIGGAIYGNQWGTMIVLTSATIGSTIAFWTAQRHMRQRLQARFPKQFEFIDKGTKEHGPSFLFFLRLNPVMPFFVVNLLMGLTSISTLQFMIVSFIGMAPGTWLYVNAGQHLSEIQSPSEILNTPVIISLILLGASPAFFKWVGKKFGPKIKP